MDDVKYSDVTDITLDIFQYISFEVYVIQLITKNQKLWEGGPAICVLTKHLYFFFSFSPIWILPIFSSIRNSRVSSKGIH